MSRKISQRRNFSRFTRVYILLHTQSSYPNDCPYCLTRGRGFAFHPFHSTQWLVEWVTVLIDIGILKIINSKQITQKDSIVGILIQTVLTRTKSTFLSCSNPSFVIQYRYHTEETRDNGNALRESTLPRR